MNDYSYVGANPINRADPSGLCWLNPNTTDFEKSECHAAFSSWTTAILDEYPNWPPDVSAIVRDEVDYWSALSFSEFARQWNSGHPLPSQGSTTQQFTTIVSPWAAAGGAIALGDSPAPGPMDIIGGVIVTGAVCYAAYEVATQPHFPDRAEFPFHFAKDLGIDARLGTIAEHIAKLLDTEVLGYPGSGSNPNRDPDGGWCRTIRRAIQDIQKKSSRMSEAQFNRELAQSGWSGDRWAQLLAFGGQLIAEGLCNDHWDDFDGGFLAG